VSHKVGRQDVGLRRDFSVFAKAALDMMGERDLEDVLRALHTFNHADFP
jgi:hypothetical protein